MELLDRDTFLEWMERIMTRFDHLKQTIPDIPQRPMLNGEPLLDNQEVCMMLQISKRTLQRYRDSGTLPFHIIYHKTWYLESEITAFMKHHFTGNMKGNVREKHRGKSFAFCFVCIKSRPVVMTRRDLLIKNDFLIQELGV